MHLITRKYDIAPYRQPSHKSYRLRNVVNYHRILWLRPPFQTVQPNNFVERNLRQEKEIIIRPHPFYWSSAQLTWQNKPVTPILLKPRPHNCCKRTQTRGKLSERELLVLLTVEFQSGTVFLVLNLAIYISSQISVYIGHDAWWVGFTLSRLEVRRDAGESIVRWENPAEIGMVGQSAFCAC